MFLPTIKHKVILSLTLLSIILLILSIILIVDILPKVIKNGVLKNIQLIPGSLQYDAFLELPFPIIFKVYFFHVENPADIYKGHKPIVKEVGPYVYKQFRRKVIHDVNVEDDTITYTQNQWFEFDAEASSNLSESDVITMANIPLLTSLQIAEDLNSVGLLTSCIKHIFPEIEHVFINVSVRDALFDGIPFCHKHLSFCALQQVVTCQLAEERRNVEKAKNDTHLNFSFFNYKVQSDDGLYVVKRGVNDSQTLGQIVKWNNMTYTTFWKQTDLNNTCNKIMGTDSTLYHPLITKKDNFYVYATDICRSMMVSFSGEDTYKNIPGFTYSTNYSTLRAQTKSPEKDCFCIKQTRDIDGKSSCFLDGIIDIQSCTGAPILLSFPHFLWADESYINDISGLFPNEDLHKTFVTLEPETGIPLAGSKRFQINVVLRPIQKFKETKNISSVVLPILWMDEGFSLTDDYVQKLENMYFDKVLLADAIKWSFFGFSVLISVSLLLYVFHKFFVKKSIN